MNKKLAAIASAIAISIGASPSIAAPIYSSSTQFTVCNSSYSSCTTPQSDWQSFAGTPSSANLTNETYQDLRYYGLDGDIPVSTTMTFSGKAQSSPDGLKAFVSGSQFSEAYTPNVGDVLESGQTQPTVSSSTSFRDNLTFTGASNLHSILFDVNIHGTRANALFGSFIQVDGSGVLFGSNDSTWDGIDNFNITKQSALFNLSSGIASISLSLYTMLDFFVGGEYFDNESGGMYREVDFFNTVTIGQFRGYDASGELVDLASATGSDGRAFDVLRVASGTVPEPSAIWLVFLGLIGLIGISKKSPKTPVLTA